MADDDELEQDDDQDDVDDDIIEQAERIAASSFNERKKEKDRQSLKRRLSVSERRREVFRLRMEGNTLEQIAESLGVSYSTVQKDSVVAAANIDMTRYLEREVNVDIGRLEALIGAYWKRATAGDLNAAKFIRECINQRGLLLGLNAPKRVDVRMIIAQWAERQGLDVDDVVEAAFELLPESQ